MRAYETGRGRGKEPSSNGIELRLPPNSLEAEQAALGCCLISTESVGKVVSALEPEDYYLEAHRLIHRAIADLAATGAPVNTFSVPDELARHGHLEKIGDVKYINELTDAIPTTAHVEHYITVILEKSARRRLIEQADHIKARAQESPDGAAALVDEASARVEKIRSRVRKAGGPEVVTARELQSKKLPPILFVVPKILPQGLVILHSRPKTGKTRLADGLALSVSSGGLFLGKIRVEQAGVLCLYLEDTDQTAQERLAQYLGDETAPEAFHYAFKWNRPDQGGFADLAAFLQKHPDVRLVIIDTLERLRPPRRDGNVYADDMAVVAQFKDLADEHGICLLVIHHSRKSGDVDDLVDSASGTAGVSGSADTIIRLRRTPGGSEAVLEGRGRKVREFELALRMDERAGWQLLGDATEVMRSGEEREVIELFAAGESLRPQDVAAELGIQRNTAQQRLRRMAQRGALIRNRGGWYSVNRDGISGVTPVTDVSPVSGEADISGHPCKRERTGELCEDLDADAQNLFADVDITPDPDTLTALTGVTSVTDLTALTPVIPSPKTNGSAPEAELRLRVRLLAMEQGFPELTLGDGEGQTVKGTETFWSRFCQDVAPEWIRLAERALEARGAQGAG